MLNLQTTTKYEKDLKKLQKKNQDLSRLYEAIELLKSRIKLPDSYRDHALSNSGSFKGQRGCHIAPNCVLIYEIEKNLKIKLNQIGSHNHIYEQRHKRAVLK